jgi:hypothetical protein
MTEYFKNPFRGRKVIIPEPYVPEYSRLDIDTIEYPVKDPEEFEKMNRKAAEEKRKSEKKKKTDEIAKSAVDKFRNGELSKEDLEKTLHNLYRTTPTQEVAATQEVPTTHEVVSTKLVSSGQNEDVLWTKGLESKSGNETIVVDEVNDEITDVPSPPTSPFVEDIQEIDTIKNIKESMSNIEDDVDGFDLDQIDVGDYVLLYKNSILGMGSISYIKETLSNILNDSDEGQSIDDFVVMKRVSVRSGIFIDE